MLGVIESLFVLTTVCAGFTACCMCFIYVHQFYEWQREERHRETITEQCLLENVAV